MKCWTRYDGGDFVTGKFAFEPIDAAGNHLVSLPPIVDLSQCRHLKCASIACLAALGARANRTIPLIMPEDVACFNHLVRLRLPEWFQLATLNPVVEQRHTNVPVRQLVGFDPAFANNVMSVWAFEMGSDLSVGLQPIFENHIDEMILNALGHSASSVGCFVAGQGFPNAGYVEVAIVDLGMTIGGHLRRVMPDLTSDVEAIETAFREHVTGTPKGQTNLIGMPNSGSGLTSLHDFCRMGNGVLSVVSGYGCVNVSGAGHTSYRRHPYFAGTLVNVKFNTQINLPTAPVESIMWG